MKACYLFDMDGTIRDDFAAVFWSTCGVFRKFGRKPPSLDEYRSRESSEFWSIYKKHGFAESEKRDVVRYFKEIFHSKYENLVRPFPDAFSTIKTLKYRGALIGVVSNNQTANVRSQLRSYGLSGFVSTVVGGEDCDERKPSPKPLLTAFGRLGINPEDGCYTADKTWDIMSAHAAGTTAIAISREKSYHNERMLLAAKPDRLIHSLKELLCD